MLQRFLPSCFKDFLCLVLIILVAMLWILTGLKALELPAEVTGALIVTWTLLVQYYFRKKQSAETKE
jgi:hypothetical protein